MELMDAMPGGAAQAPVTTGRYLVLMDPEAVAQAMKTVNSATGVELSPMGATEAPEAVAAALQAGASVVFPELGVAVFAGDPQQTRALGGVAEGVGGIIAVEPERVVHIFDDSVTDYLRGYRDGVNQAIDRALAEAAAAIGAEAVAPTQNETAFTWGLQATRVDRSQLSGRGVRVAVLDTGMDLTHPDFQSRPIVWYYCTTPNALALHPIKGPPLGLATTQARSGSPPATGAHSPAPRAAAPPGSAWPGWQSSPARKSPPRTRWPPG